MGVFDDILRNDPNEQEWEDVGSFADIPAGKWFLLRAYPADVGKAASGVEPPNEWRDWHTIKLGFEPIGAEEGVGPANYGGFFHRFSPDTKAEPGEPSGKVKGLINKFFAPSLEKGSEERTAAARAVLSATAEKFSMSPEDTENYPTLAVYVAAVMCAAMCDRQPTILVKTWLRKGREYTTADGEKRQSRDRIEIGTFTDDTPENREKHGIVVWPTGAEPGGDVAF